MTVRSLQPSSWFVVLCLVIAVGCGQQNNSPIASNGADSNQATESNIEQVDERGEANDTSIVFEGLVIHAPVTHDNLTIFPVSRVEPNMEDRFITLDEGLKEGTVEVFELGAGNENREQPTEGLLDPSEQNDDPFGAEPADLNPLPQPNQEQPCGEQQEQEQPNQEELNQGNDSEQASQTASNQQVDGAAENQQSNNAAQQTGSPEFSNQGTAQLIDEDFQGNNVNRVYVLNRSDRPLYLMPGEIILGGDQDRTIGEEIVIAPSKEPVQVEVFCVEHGRWGGRSRERTTQELAAAIGNSANAQSFVPNLSLAIDTGDDASIAAATEQLSEQAANGKFIASAGLLTKKARLVAQGDKDQSKVWDEVAVANNAATSQIDSGSFTINYVNEENIKRFAAFVESLQDKVANQENVVGVIVAVNGKIDGVDVFESTPLFKKLWPKLLKSYALEAANQSSVMVAELTEDVSDEAAGDEASDEADGNPQLATCTLQDALDFLKQAKEANETTVDVKDGLAISHRSDESVDSFSLRVESSAAAEIGGGGGFGSLSFG